MNERIITHYRVLEKLGGGAMGVVYKAEDTRLRRPVALKLLPREWSRDPNARERFLREAQAASALDHPHICTVHEVDETDEGQLFLAMAYYGGETLKKRLQRGPMPVPEAIILAIQVAEGLARAHEAGILHRDIKPANLMVTERGDAKIVDFGLAKLANAEGLTRTGAVVGTAAYMSPEQARGGELGPATDVWALGAVLYEMLAGRRPFEGEYEQAVVYAILHEDPEPVERVRPEVPAALAEVVRRSLEKDPTKRFTTAEELAEALREVKREVMPAAPAGRFPIVIRWPRGRWARRAVPAGVAALAVAVGVLSLPGPRRAVSDLAGWHGLPRDKHLVVLPFRNVGEDPGIQATCDGLTEILTARLGRLQQFHGSLRVVPAAEVVERGVHSAGEAARAFEANLALAPSMRATGDGYQVTLSLVDPRTMRLLGTRELAAVRAEWTTFQMNLVLQTADLLRLYVEPRAREILTAGESRDESASAAYTEARGHLRYSEEDDRVEAAIELLTSAVRTDPRFALAYDALGEAHWQKARRTNDPASLDAAVEFSARAVGLEGRLVQARTRLGRIYLETSRLDQAVDELRRAVQSDPADAYAYLELGRAYDRMRKDVEAEQALRQAIMLQPNAWAGYSYLGRFYFNRGRFSEAEAMFVRATQVNPEQATGFSLLGATLTRMRRFPEAERAFARSLEINPSHAAANNLATAYWYQRRFGEAAARFQQAIELGNNDYRVWGGLGDSRRHLGDGAGARDAYRTAMDLARQQLAVAPNAAEVNASIARYAVWLGETELALREIRTAEDSVLADNNVFVSYLIVHEQLGLRDEAIRSVREAAALGKDIGYLDNDPDLDELRRDSRYPGTTHGARADGRAVDAR
jgi:eukaryotic-like serine/threonine-protein kinase